MEILTKMQVAEIAIRPNRAAWGDAASNKSIIKTSKYSDYKLIKAFRKSTGLMLCSFAPNKFYIRYN